MGVSAEDTVDFGALAGAEGFIGVKAPDAAEAAFTAEDFVDAGDAAMEVIGDVEEGGIGIG